jgi:Spy/CpxP family protein refolding chaperone
MIGSRGTASALLIVTFIVGALSGAGYQAYADRAPTTTPTYLDRLTTQLRLNETQQQRVKAILEQYSAPMDSLWAEIRPKYEPLRQAMRADIRQVLTDEQRTKYEEMLRRYDAERSNRQGAPRARP